MKKGCYPVSGSLRNGRAARATAAKVKSENRMLKE
jgi:hypothetical protein